MTRGQLEIARMVAMGLSNREIAAFLHLSIRTVECQIYRACQRTQTHSRHELRALL